MATGGEEFDATRAVKAELDARRPVEALVEASRDADLLIVGSRGLRGMASLGSVAERVAHKAECPVLIVRFRYASRPAPRAGSRRVLPVKWLSGSARGTA